DPDHRRSSMPATPSKPRNQTLTNPSTPMPRSTTLPSLKTRKLSRPTVSAAPTNPGLTCPSTYKNVAEKKAPASCVENGATSLGNAQNTPSWAALSGPSKAKNVSTSLRRTTLQI
ncbi:hypothetical protein C0992_006456, partial [Termitomyces sp. T32_za158]